MILICGYPDSLNTQSVYALVCSRPHGNNPATEIIIEAGLMLIAEAETASKRPQITRARMVRDGLMFELLAHYPVRLKKLRGPFDWP